MASKKFLLLALAFAVVLLIASQVAEAEDLTSKHDGEVDGHGGYNHGGHGGHGKGGGHGGHGGGRGGCKHGCCGHYNHGGCKCCSTFEEATTYKQTQN